MVKLFGFLQRKSLAEDPVCHMMVDTKNPPGGAFEHGGKTYYFCSPGCRMSFQEDPEGYLSGAKREKM